MEWLTNSNQIVVEPPKRPLKLTGTRLATILGLNPWQTPFSAWCEITRTYKEPFVDSIYTIAGKTIEPIQAEYLKQNYALDNLVTAEDVYGPEPYKKTRGDFFSSEPIFGGMWDSLLTENDIPEVVIEFKTTKRAEDWAEDVPEYYALQASLYAWLLGCDDVMMVASFLGDEDYTNPQNFTPSVDNTITHEFKVSERYADFEEIIETAERWWRDHVETGLSPEFDEKKDADILKVLRTNFVNPETDIEKVIAEAEALTIKINKANERIDKDKKRLSNLKDQLKKFAMEQFRDGDTKVSLAGKTYEFELSKTFRTTVDSKALEADGLLEKYQNTSESYTLRTKEVK